jgi:hypothetical protein
MTLPPPETLLLPPEVAPLIGPELPPKLPPALPTTLPPPELRPALGSDDVGELSLLPQPNMTLMPDAARSNAQKFDLPKKLT